MKNKFISLTVLLFLIALSMINISCSANQQIVLRKSVVDPDVRAEKRKIELDEMSKEFQWWPSDAQPAPVQDPRGGFWWWPDQPGQARPWGNRGFIYMYKVIYDYKAQDDEDEEVQEEPAPQVQVTPEEPKKPELKPSLLVKKIIRNVKIYFDYNKADLRDDHLAILKKALKTLQNNPQANILITGNCDTRGSDEYNLKLGKKRGAAVQQFMLENGIEEERVKIISRGKLDAVAPVTDIEGMQKDRNAQFMIAEVEELMLPTPQKPTDPGVQEIEEGKYMVETEEKLESEPMASTKEYVIQKNDSLWKIAAKEMGSGHRWKYLYEFNKDRIKDPNRLKAGKVILIPVE